jgi:hypothetical protein
MILLMRNHVDEFFPGCDYTAVKLDAALLGTIRTRAMASSAVRWTDESLSELHYWDASPQCIGSLDADIQESIDAELDRGDGWTVLSDNALGSFKEAHTDCTRMIIVAGESFSVAWSYRVGSEPILTVAVPLADLASRLGSPTGNALVMIP